MKKVIISWKSHTESGYWLGVKSLNKGFYAKFVIECTKETFDALPNEGEEIEVPAEVLS